MARQPIPTWFFVLAVVRSGDRFLLVHEQKHGQTWYLPAGRVRLGEDLVTAIERETLEEAGIRIRVDGVIRVEHSPRADGGCRVRVFFLGSPLAGQELKQTPDEDSLGAAWVSLEELSQLPLRGPDVRDVLEYVALGGPTYPLSLLTWEGAPYPPPADHLHRRE